MKINIGISNRHVHLNKDDLEVLFGSNYELTHKKDLVQLGEFAACETVSIKGIKGLIENVRVLGPTRDYTQVEISKTDSYKLGINPPIRKSGDVTDSSPITIIGPAGELNKQEGCIIANRHIHMDLETSKKLGLSDNQEVSVLVDTEKGSILNHVFVKVTEKGVLEMHIDMDDANANLVTSETMGEIIVRN